MSVERRDRLAALSAGFAPSAPARDAADRAQRALATAIAELGRYRELHLFVEQAAPDDSPERPPFERRTRIDLPRARDLYSAIYCDEREQATLCPHAIRPRDDWTPIVSALGASHARGQWTNLLAAALSGALRPTDRFIFRSEASRRAAESVFERWTESFGVNLPPHGAVVGAAVSIEDNVRDPKLRAEIRRELGVGPEDVLFLVLGRLETSGAMGRSLVASWRDVVGRCPRAVLVLSGPQVDRAATEHLRTLARVAGIAGRVIVIADPSKTWSDPRRGLLSAADVFVQLPAGADEISQSALLEAMAHGLPVLGSRWSGMDELVVHGEQGLLADARVAPIPASTAQSFGGLSDAQYGRLLAGAVACDPSKVVEHAVAMAAGADARARFAENALRAAARHSFKALAEKHVEVFDEASEAARTAWTGEPRERPLVDSSLVLRALAGEDEPRS